jgi:hypothetical protein
MAIISINIPDNKLAEFIAAYSDNYESILPGGVSNPLTRNQHARIELNRHIKQRVISWKHDNYQLPDFDDSGITIS